MTVAAQKELKEKALASIPVKAGGGYQFIYTKDQGGIVYVYPDKYGEKYKEGLSPVVLLRLGIVHIGNMK